MAVKRTFILDCIVFIHLYSASLSMSLLEALQTTALILCWSKDAKALQATASEGLAQGSYVEDGVGLEPATLRTQGTEPTTEPPRPIHIKMSSLIVSKTKKCLALKDLNLNDQLRK